MEKQPNHTEARTTPNEKLVALQERMAAIACGEQLDLGDATPDIVSVEGMYNLKQALRKAKGRRSGTEELKI